MVVSNSRLDKRIIKLLTLNRNYFVTEKNDTEINVLLGESGYRKIFKNKTKIISFEDLRKITPEVCPLYYNLILQMNNSAVVLSPDFFISQVNAHHLKNKKLSPEEQVAKNKIIDDLIKQKKSEAEILKDLGIRPLPNTDVRKFQKKKCQSIKNGNKNAMNDMRSFAVALLYALIHQRNVVFVTADSDFIDHFFSLTEGVADQWALKTKVLSLLTEENRKTLYAGKDVELSIDAFKHAEERMNQLRDLFSDRWKKKSFVFKVKFWNQGDGRYESVSMTINEVVRALFLNSPGPYNCHFARNNEMGNWLHIKYWWPPEDPEDVGKMRIVVTPKSQRHGLNVMVPERVHDASCLYVQKDKENDLGFFSSFID